MYNTLNVGPHGFVRLVETMPAATAESINLDSAVVQAARISTGQGVKDPVKDRALIRYLMRNKHTSPFEMVELKFHIKMPIFIARQWMRHRMASINEYSGRYATIPDQCYTPQVNNIRVQSTINLQASDSLADPHPQAHWFVTEAEQFCDRAYDTYMTAVEAGIAREQARMLLPQSMYTEFYWKIDLHNFLNFVRLRASKHAQFEIQEFAKAAYNLVKPLVPVSCEAFEDYVMEAVTFSKQEIAALKGAILELGLNQAMGSLTADLAGFGKSEQAELLNKLEQLDITPHPRKHGNG